MTLLHWIWILFCWIFPFVRTSGFIALTMKKVAIDNVSLTPYRVSVCFGLEEVNLEAFFKDCSLGEHNFTFQTTVVSDYHKRIPFSVKWPTENPIFVSFLVDSNDDLVTFQQFEIKNIKPGKQIIRRIPFFSGFLSFSLNFFCDPFYFGNSCTTYCKEPPFNSSFSNGQFKYSCSKKGKRICEKGWMGSLCDIPLPPKCNTLCVHGNCTDTNKCRCLNGWKGVDCSICVPQRNCLHGYCIQPFQCICEKEWTGERCDIPLSICALLSPCVNGNCSSKYPFFDYNCHCEKGFHGKNCDLSVPYFLENRSDLSIENEIWILIGGILTILNIIICCLYVRKRLANTRKEQVKEGRDQTSRHKDESEWIERDIYPPSTSFILLPLSSHPNSIIYSSTSTSTSSNQLLHHFIPPPLYSQMEENDGNFRRENAENYVMEKEDAV